MKSESELLDGIHFLLTYECNFECNHCFLHCSPNSKGTFTLNQITHALDEATKIDSVRWIYFEGGEPFLYYPLMLEGIKLAKERGFKIGIVTNSYWATCEEDAKLWLREISHLEISDFSISDDEFHYGEGQENLAKYAKNAANQLRIPTLTITIEKTGDKGLKKDQGKGEPVVGGDIMVRGRAADLLIDDLPREKWREWKELRECPYEDLEGLGRVHLDCYGNTQVCQGLSIGNYWKTPLSDLVKNYDPKKHPICGPLLKGGPAHLIETYNLKHDEVYVDECHLCYAARKALIDKFPEYLGPKQVYGLEE